MFNRKTLKKRQKVTLVKRVGLIAVFLFLVISTTIAVYFVKSNQDSRSQARDDGGDFFIAGYVACKGNDGEYYSLPDVKVKINRGNETVDVATPDKRDRSWVFESKQLKTGSYSVSLDIPTIVHINGKDVSGVSLGKPSAVNACRSKMLLCTNKDDIIRECADESKKTSYDNCFLNISPSSEFSEKPYFDFTFESCGTPILKLDSESLLRKEVALHSSISDGSQYSPFVLSFPGWASTPMYYCKNVPVNGVFGDKVWRTENYWTGQGWVGDAIQVQGKIDAEDDLSCSPGIVLDTSNTWHMYYVVANRNTDMKLSIYHATASAPGLDWQKKGKIDGATKLAHEYYESPSPFIIDGKFVVYLTGGGGRLLRMESSDGQQFSEPITVYTNPLKSAQAGYVSKIENKWYYTYAVSKSSKSGPPNQIWLATSDDGLNWRQEGMLFENSSSGWDSKFIFSPRLMFDYVTKEYKLYYAGTPGTSTWWGSGSSIGYQVIDVPSMKFSK